MQASPSPKLRVAICGGGIGGLTLAVALASVHDVHVDIYEAAQRFTEIGAGVGMWLRTWKIMQTLGLAPALEGIANRVPDERPQRAFEFRKGDQPEGVTFYTMTVPFGVLTLHRADFQQVLANRISSSCAHFSKRLVSYTRTQPSAHPPAPSPSTSEPDVHAETPPGGITLHFADGTSATCDLLVGADGIKSATRLTLLREQTDSVAPEAPPQARAETKTEPGSGSGSGSGPGPGDLSSSSASAPGRRASSPSPPASSLQRISPSLSRPSSASPGPEVDAASVAEDATASNTEPEPEPGRASELPSQSQSQSETPETHPLAEPIWSGTVVYRYLIPSARLAEAWPEHRALSGPTVYFGKNKHIVAFPISQGRAVNLVAFCSSPDKEGTRFDGAWVAPAPAAELRAAFPDWEPEIAVLLSLADTPARWAIHVLGPLPSYTADGVALIGDAAHAMTPHQGAGAGQAIEDAYVLAALLAHPRATRRTLPQLLRAYDAVRLPFARGVAARSRMNGMMYNFNWTLPVAGRGDGERERKRRKVQVEEEEEEDREREREVGGEAEAATAAADGDTGADSRVDDGARTADADELKRLAEAIMEIHKWEWETDAVDQRDQALGLFEQMIAREAVATEV